MTVLQMFGAGVAFFLAVLLFAWLWRGYSNVVNAVIAWIKALIRRIRGLR